MSFAYGTKDQRNVFFQTMLTGKINAVQAAKSAGIGEVAAVLLSAGKPYKKETKRILG